MIYLGSGFIEIHSLHFHTRNFPILTRVVLRVLADLFITQHQYHCPLLCELYQLMCIRIKTPVWDNRKSFHRSANPEACSMPGWGPMEKALGFLIDDARHSGSDCARKGFGI